MESVEVKLGWNEIRESVITRMVWITFKVNFEAIFLLLNVPCHSEVVSKLQCVAIMLLFFTLTQHIYNMLFYRMAVRKKFAKYKGDNCFRECFCSSRVVDIASVQVLQLSFNSSLFGKVQRVTVVQYYCPFLPSSTQHHTQRNLIFQK